MITLKFVLLEGFTPPDVDEIEAAKASNFNKEQ